MLRGVVRVAWMREMPAVTLPELVAADAAVLLDGGLATELEARGEDLSDARWSARLLEDDPEAIVGVHEAYLDAGARVLITASYQATEPALLRRSVELARTARERAGRPDALVAASVGPYGAILAGGQEYTGDYGAATAADVEAFHERRLRALLEATPDCVACETIPRADEAAGLAAILDRLCAPPAWISFACRDGAHTAHGEPIEEAVAAATTSARVVAVGVNCTAPEHVAALLKRMRAVTPLPLVVYPNSGRVWDGSARRWSEPGAAELPDAAVRAWVAAGARLVGGCCGLGPDAIRGIGRALAGAQPTGVDCPG
jgi:homocysteine S-methyltransferase